MLEKDATRCMNGEAYDMVDLSDDKLNNVEEEVKVVGKSSRYLLFRERMKRLLPHRCPLKDRMMDKTICYVDLFQPCPPPSRTDDEMKPQTSRRLAKRK